MDEQALKEQLIETAQAFGSKWNEHEAYVLAQSKAQKEARPQFASDEEKFAWLKANPQTDWFEEFSKLVTPLFDAYCTDKQRVYGGKNPGTFGFPQKFNGIETPVDTSVAFKNKNRAEVYFKTETKFKDEYLFVMLRKANQWRIDSYKGRRYGSEKWDNKIL